MPSPLEQIVDNLRDEFTREGEQCAVIETHISIVLLTSRHAYKFKRAVDLGFLDFRDLERRRYYCEREIALNRRSAPDLYLHVARVVGTPQAPRLDGAGAAIEYAVVMQRFADDALAIEQLLDGRARAREYSAFGHDLACLHASAPRCAGDDRYGSAALVGAQITQACAALPAPVQAGLEGPLKGLLENHAALIESRQQAGFVRECHGDLHLGNIVARNGRLSAFDCIEFSDELRIIDTMSDVAFVAMDLDRHQRGDLANHFLQAYIETSGDFGGLALFRLYALYRALVRARVAGIRCDTAAGREADEAARERDAYAQLAMRYGAPRPPAGLVITHGLSGSGKSHGARLLAARSGFIHLRSDRERLHDSANAGPSPEPDRYSPQAVAATYRRLSGLGRTILEAGHSVVVDATFLDRDQRTHFRELAGALGLPFHILIFAAPDAVLRQRIVERQSRNDDLSEATLAVLDAQQRQWQPLCAAEQAVAVDAVALRLATCAGDELEVFGAVRPGLERPLPP